jgi:hypothetical protein
VAEVRGLHRAPLGESSYWKMVRERSRDASGVLPPDLARRVDALCDAVEARHGDLDLEFGTWHGDWSPWNMCTAGGRLLVWDWERFTDDVPRGFDLLHYGMQDSLVRHGTSPRDAAEACVSGAPATLAALGEQPAPAELVAALYLLTLGIRYEQDGQEEAGSPLGRLETWLLPTLEHELRLPRSPDGKTP